MELRSYYDQYRSLLSIRKSSIFFLISLLLAVSYRRFVVEFNDPNKCQALIHDGHWYGNHEWLTSGCVSQHQYYHTCLKDRKVVFIGDETIQGVYWALLRRMDHDIRMDITAGDLKHTHDHIDLRFYWDPYLNSSKLHDYAKSYGKSKESRPSLTIVGAGRWYADGDASDEFIKAIDETASTANPGRSRSMTVNDGPGDQFLFAPVQEPYTDDSGDKAAFQSYSDINTHLLQQSQGGSLDLLSAYTKMTDGRKDKYLDDGVNVDYEVLEKRADLLISLRCNAKAEKNHGWPFTRTCCGVWPMLNWQQGSFLVLAVIVFPAIVLLDYRLEFLDDNARKVVRAFSAFTAAITLQYLTDRTHLFEQTQRLLLVKANLFSMLAIALIVGLITIRRSKPPKGKANPGEKPPRQPFLSRDQSDEWKGWMQLAIIIYHYNMGWHLDWYWMVIRTTVAAYLFLTGFGHTLYFLQKSDYSWKRFVAVMIRTNLLPSTLAYVLNTRWLKYYYMPLSTFWFLVVFVTLAIGHKNNHNRLFVMAKMAISAALVTAFLQVKELPDTLVKFFVLSCNMSFNSHAFFGHRVTIDHYVVYVGMFCAIIYIWMKDALSSNSRQGFVSRIFKRSFFWLQYVGAALALVVLVGFWYWVQTQVKSQGRWTTRQPYLTWIPIVTFLIVRNGHSSLRNYYSFVFAWLGRYSGEMYVMQNHIWLAGDQESVLRTGLFHGNETVAGDRWRDLVLTTPLFFLACCIIGDATATITTWFVADRTVKETKVLVSEPPIDEVEMGLLADEDGESDDEKPTTNKEVVPPRISLAVRLKDGWSNLKDAIIPTKVRDRFLLLLAWMWFLNWTYT